MREVAITINGRSYQVSCDEGEEERLQRLGAFVDERAAELVQSVGNVGDVRLMVMTSLLLADKLFDAIAELERLRAQAAQGKTGGDAAPLVEEAAKRIEDIAARLESA